MIGLSILSGSHRELIPSVIEALREAGGGDIPLVVGGIIPDADVGAPARGRRRRGLHAEGLRAHAHPARRRGARGGAKRHRVRRGVSAGEGRPAPISDAGSRARDLHRRARGAEPRREPVPRRAAGDRRAARRRVPRRARRRGARARRRGHRAAGGGQVDAAERARGRLAPQPGGASRCSRSTRRPSARAARCSATARGSTPTPPTAASSSARWRPASGSAASPPPRAPPPRRSPPRSTSW